MGVKNKVVVNMAINNMQELEYVAKHIFEDFSQELLDRIVESGDPVSFGYGPRKQVVQLEVTKVKNGFRCNGAVLRVRPFPLFAPKIVGRLGFLVAGTVTSKELSIKQTVSDALLSLETQYLAKMLSSREPLTFTVSKERQIQVEAVAVRGDESYSVRIYSN